MRAVGAEGKVWQRLRSLHTVAPLKLVDLSLPIQPIVVSEVGHPVWLWMRVGNGGILLIGTHLAGDLVRYRQGDPDAAADRSNSELWGLSGERPVYLYERQLAGEGPNERHADWWCWTLREALQRYAGCKADTVLPDGAPGAVVVTGDDDQAFLGTYERQRTAPGDLPVTYFCTH